ncbi:MAG: glycosyltransferase family 2 protein [Chloroflexi bacterium]|nr:glycosyltransferase family 2 protein [Chloroflexota bacterium]MCI0645737.1 glycosyltransferase family 2 protein [Chloroflexota bacterium]MCI0727664.1 glycosyltransferase family 2 protein [Chloroflexota bacterium]
MTTLSIVIPAYNEEQGIAAIVQRVLDVRPELAQVGVTRLELLVVDDGSADRTADVAGGIDQVRLIRHGRNRGYGAALKTGFGQASGELIGFLDADGTYPPECFPQLCQAALNGADLVIGSRRAGAASHMPLARRLGNWFFANLLSLVGRQRVSDSASGMRVFKREVLARIYPLPDGLNLTPVMSTRAIHEGIAMAEVPIPYSERVGRSKLSVVRDGSIFLHSIIWTALTYNPVRILGLLGLSGVALALLVAAGLVAARLSGVTTLGPWGVAAVFAALVAGVTGISVFSLGVTFNYLVSLFYKQPVRQGLFGRPIFKTPLDRHFGWMGVLAGTAGLGLAAASLALGLTGWEIARLWLYLLASAMLILVGAQLVIYWILLRVLDELSQREGQTQKDMNVS